MCDGHGINGHIVSGQIKEKILDIFQNFLKEEPEKIGFCLHNCMIELQRDLERNNKYDVSLSGTTCSLIYLSGNSLYTSNLGDSRSILIRFDGSSKGDLIKVRQLTDDHKPEVPKEKQRIIK